MVKRGVTRRAKKQRGGMEEKLNSPTAAERRAMAALRREMIHITTPNEMSTRLENVIGRIQTRQSKTRKVGSRILPRGKKLRYNNRE